MKYLLVLCAIGFAAAANYGEYVPRAYYTIDEEGNPSAAQPIGSSILNRARRQIQTYDQYNQGFGSPFAFPQPIVPYQVQPIVPLNVQPGTQGTYVSSSQTLSSRFDGDEPVYNHQSTVGHHSNGRVHETRTYTRPDGSRYSETRSNGR